MDPAMGAVRDPVKRKGGVIFPNIDQLNRKLARAPLLQGCLDGPGGGAVSPSRVRHQK